MASSEHFIKYIEDQLTEIDQLVFKKMFGEITIYLNEKVVAMICDNQFLIKVTESGKQFIKNEKYGEPYPGGKKCFLIDEDIEDKLYIREFLYLTEKELPKPKKKKKKKK